MKNKIFLAVLLLAASAVTLAAAETAGDAAQGKAKSAVCGACHGADGNSVNPVWPKIAGQSTHYILSQLRAFKTGERKNPVMAPQAQMLAERDMADLAAYFSSQVRSSGVADEALVKAGEHLYRGGNASTGVPACMACHGPDGAGNALSGYPALAGQHAAYVLAALQSFIDGTRSSKNALIMKDIASRMSEQERRAVASYVQGLH